MTMNLIQIQDKLKSLPNDPRVMQLLTGYANGQNPQVPPYLALGELNRRKGEMERAQMEKAGQPPGGTVKDQIEQQTGVMALQQGRQQQAMQNMVRQGMAGPAPAPQGIAQPQPQAQAMASGGLASLAPKGYRSGGMVAFSKAGDVNAAVEEDDDEGEGEAVAAGDATDIEAMFAKLAPLLAAQQKAKAPTVESLEARRNRMAEENPDRYGILNTPVGKDALERLEGVQSARRAELATQKEELAKSKPGILQLLGQAAMGTRGQKGGSALASILGGYSELASGADAKQLQQEQGLRMRELELQQAKAEAMNKVDDLRRARADGDVVSAQKIEMDLAKMAKDLGVSVNTLLGKQFSTLGSMVARDRAAKTAAKAKVDAARITGNKPEKPTDLGNMINIEFAALVANGADPADPNTRRVAAQNAARALSKSAGTTRAETDAIDKANAAFESKVLMDRNLRKLRTEDPIKYDLRLKEIRSEVEAQYKVRPDAAAPISGADAPAAKPATPSAKPAAGGKVMTMADVRATAKANNKTEAEVIAAAKAKGFKIQ
jgi:hypothetical protein